MDVNLTATHTDTPEALLLRQENQQTVVDALENLPARYREVILLCEVEEFSYREIAEILSLPIGTVISRLHRAKHALRHSLNGRMRLGGLRMHSDQDDATLVEYLDGELRITAVLELIRG
ncbi:sigma-70 family RNA polymerase sigma factor [Alloacidobacterium dinghuense]|uniref:Sigma-70 family RNA polymerase sigma factor n=1 Tax=Alloacidobacterium dinghuense TaxID=2763107 RepID=A0A7G8BDL7_9BACT|nr:sigma-70 family RNA polymerase sigma factor [Alloacidobacterium dinghuense]QNI30637.1 sigma-70 family RNA polymerase sigma factor [Alloacidobacterium dinghuense]